MKPKIQMRAYKGLFMNSKILFVEYIDIIRAPYLILLKLLSESRIENAGLQEPFDISPVKNLSSEELVYWYYQRKNRNFLLDLIPEKKMSNVKISDADAFLDNQIASMERVVDVSFPLNFADVLHNLFFGENKIADQAFIYYPTNNQVIRNDVEKTFEDMPVSFVYGDMAELIKDYQKCEVTYVFSDITNVQLLADMGKLDRSSIILPAEYAYNQCGDDWKIDFSAYQKEATFKYDFFFATGF